MRRRDRIGLFLLALSSILCLCLFAATPQAQADENLQSEQKNVLFINSYSYEFDTVPIVLDRVSTRLNGVASVQYLFMDEKHVDDAFATQQLEFELDVLTAEYHYDAVILGDDAAFDFAISHRDRYFSGVPLIYEDINSIEKVQKYDNDPLVTGIVEVFPMKQTIELARTLMPNATRVVVINDDSVSAQGSTQQALAEQTDFPDLNFETFDCSQYTPEEIQQTISQYGDDTILLYTVFNTDGLGNRYTVAQGVHLVTEAANVPVFKADEAGVGDGLIGGCVLSYDSIGDQTAQLVTDVLNGDTDVLGQSYQMGQSKYEFDFKVMERYGISKSQVPAGSTFINDEPSFMERYGEVLIPSVLISCAIIIAMLIIHTVRKRRLQREIERSNNELKISAAENRAKTAFISRMSHDIRTPLNAILGLNALAQESVGDPDVVRGYLEQSASSEGLLLALVNNILDVSKIESGKMELISEPYQLADFFEEIENIFGPLCTEKGISFHVEENTGDAVVSTDRTRLSQVFCNLLSNAMKFTPEGGSVAFTALCDELPSELSGRRILHVDFVVEDTGRGIPPEFQSRMFQSFTQAGDANSQSQGSGLGLTIVKSIVDLMGGTIRCESIVDVGTTFHVSIDFPLVGSEDEQSKDAGISDEELSERLRGHHVLLVEDNSLNSEIIVAALTKQGMNVECAGNGQVAVDLLGSAKAGDYDVVLMDNRMPVMDGLEATAIIRKLDADWVRNLPIIAITADAFEDDVRRFREAGMNDYLAKPLDLRKMYRVIVRYL